MIFGSAGEVVLLSNIDSQSSPMQIVLSLGVCLCLQLIVLCIAAIALARPQTSGRDAQIISLERDAQIVSYENEHREDNSYDFRCVKILCFLLLQF